MQNRRNLLEEIIKQLDITPTMYKNAKDKYLAMADFLKSQGIECNIYPQGSFRTGTVVRPIKNGQDSDYDLDMVCEFVLENSKSDPKAIYDALGKPLRESERYKNIEEYDCCFTIRYANVEKDVGFTMDIFPAVPEDFENVFSLVQSGIDKKYAESAILITLKNKQSSFEWGNSNPRGYADWFDDRNKKFNEYSAQHYRRQLYENNKKLYNFNIENVPNEMIRTSMQRVIQILKRHRDIYYSRIKTNIKKPISAVISTLVAEISEEASSNIGVFELLQLVVARLKTYSELQNTDQFIFETRYPNMSKIRKTDSKWSIKNPVNSEDNYTDGWENIDVEYFFRWIENVEKDLLCNIDEDDNRYYNGLELGFGSEIVKRFKPQNSYIPKKASNTQPWSK